MPLTQTQLTTAVADRADISRAEAKQVLEAFEEVVLEELGNAQKGEDRRSGPVEGACQAGVEGAYPATGEEITIARKPASVDVRARPRAKAKAALPSVQKARRRLAA